MSNACFDGDFRQKPQQNFSGSNRNLKREQLIQFAANERKQREELRQHNQFAVKIQSQIRKFLVTKKWFQTLRREFDVRLHQFLQKHESDNSINWETIHFLGVRLFHFYLSSCDKERLFTLNKILIKNQNLITKESGQQSQWFKHIFKFNLSALNSFLDDLINNIENLQSVLQLFDIYLCETNNFSNLELEVSNKIWVFLITKAKYFEFIQSFIEKFCVHKLANSVMYNKIYNQLLRCPLSLQLFSQHQKYLLISNFLLHFTTGFTDFNSLDKFLQHFQCETPGLLTAENLINAFERLDDMSIPINLFMPAIYSTIFLSVRLLDKKNNQMVSSYLNLLKLFSAKLHSYFNAKPHLSFKYKNTTLDDELMDDDEDDDDYEFKRNDPQDEFFFVNVKRIFSIFNSVENCNIVIYYVDNNLENDVNALESLSSVSHLMLFLLRTHAIHYNRFLHTLAFNSSFLKQLWRLVLNKNCEVSIFTDSNTNYIQMLSRGTLNMSSDWLQFLPHFTVFGALFNYFLQTLDDVEFFNELLMVSDDIQTEDNNNDSEMFSYYNNHAILPFKLSEIIVMSSILRDVCTSLIELAYHERRVLNLKFDLSSDDSNISSTTNFDEFVTNCWILLLWSLSRLLRHIYARDIRRQFCPKQHWISFRTTIQIVPQNFDVAIKQRRNLYQEFRGIKHLNRSEIQEYGSPIPAKDVINVTIIQELPFVVPFHDRVKIMQSLITHEKRLQDNNFFALIQNRSITIRRNYVYEDSYEKLSPEMVPSLKKIIRVQLISNLGLEETGVDGGGVFREFLSEALKAAFDPNRGLFKITNDGLLYPNPSVQMLYENSDSHYYFVGRLLGKAIYENMLIELPFAPFFLAKILTINSDVEINHMTSLDPVLYKNLISLKNYKGDVSELGLDFTVVTSDFGTNKIEELKPNGANIAVTKQNRIEYIHLMADYKLNKQIRNQCAAFKKGFYNVVDFDWIKMFDTKELQILISGAQTLIDLDDLRKHTVYTGGYAFNHPVIIIFWQVVLEFDEQDKRKLLKFVTSCSRPPLLGFKDLYPKFCIQKAGQEQDRLPTSSTCMNLLKLPEIYDKVVMKNKLKYSIESNSGFELS